MNLSVCLATTVANKNHLIEELKKKENGKKAVKKNLKKCRTEKYIKF